MKFVLPLAISAVAAFDCTGERTGHYASPDNCHQFYACDTEVAYLFDCPADLEWDDSRKICDWPTGNCGPAAPAPAAPAPGPSGQVDCIADPSACTGSGSMISSSFMLNPNLDCGDGTADLECFCFDARWNSGAVGKQFYDDWCTLEDDGSNNYWIACDPDAGEECVGVGNWEVDVCEAFGVNSDNDLAKCDYFPDCINVGDGSCQQSLCKMDNTWFPFEPSFDTQWNDGFKVVKANSWSQADCCATSYNFDAFVQLCGTNFSKCFAVVYDDDSSGPGIPDQIAAIETANC